MGAGASVEGVRGKVASLGPAYEPYAVAVAENGLDGEMCCELARNDQEVAETLDLLNVTATLHRKKLTTELKKAFGEASGYTAAAAAPTISGPPAIIQNQQSIPTVTAQRQRQSSSVSMGQVQVSLTWEGDVDLDLNAVSFKEGGHTLDLIYSANTETRDRSITHSGDVQGGHANSEDVTVRTNLLHPEAAAVVVFVRCHDRNASLANTVNASVTITSTTNPTTVFPLSHHNNAEAVAVFRMFKRNRVWQEEVFDFPTPEPDILKCIPIFQSGLRDVMTISSNARVDVVVLDKGGLMPIENCACLVLGLGWDPLDEDGVECDLDAGVVLLNKDNIYEDFVYYHNQDCKGVHHSGDNRTGEGDGDDEQIQIIFNELSPTVETMVLAISAYEGDFMNVHGAYVRLVDLATRREVIRFDLSGQFPETSLLCCKLYRDAGQWKLFVIGETLGGKSIVDYFWTDAYGPPAELRKKFKELSGCHFEDSLFFQTCAERMDAGGTQLRVDKDEY